jgi:selenocysteine lyase/cysteine desulfurase
MITGQLIDEFRLNKNIIYLNHAAVSPWPLRTARAVQEFTEENMTEGSSHYLRWLKVESNLREQACKLLNAPSINDIALTKNTSEALSIVAYGLDWIKGDNIVIYDQEFPSNRIVWESLSEKGVEIRTARFNGADTPEDSLFTLVNDQTRLISVSSVQYSTGLRMDLNRIGEFCRKKRIIFCIDAIQSLGAVQFDVQQAMADFVMADGHKWMLGPEGLAIFYSNPECRDRLKLNQYGWHMVEKMGDFDRKDWDIAESSRRFECGSPNMLGIHALNASLSLLLEAGMAEVEKEVICRTEYLFEMIKSRPELELLTLSEAERYAGIITCRSRNAGNAGLFQFLTDNNIICSVRGGGIRISPHFYTRYEHLDRVIMLASSVNH